MSSYLREDFNITRDEFNNISKCLKNEEFRKLFIEYCEELNDPENRKHYQQELKILEAEKGYDLKFVEPEAGYVIKTNNENNKKVFINVSKCGIVAKPTCKSSTNETGQKGLIWSLPYTQAPPRKDYDNKKKECVVYDVIFHPDTIYLTQKNVHLKNLVTETAVNAVQTAFNEKLDSSSLKYPKVSYKGTPKLTVIREKICKTTKQEDPIPESDNKFGQITDQYVTPTYKIIHRKNVDYQEMLCSADSKLNITIPTELGITVNLPKLESANNVQLDVTNDHIHLLSQSPERYKLELQLPYKVDEKLGTANFHKESCTLQITLPVLKTQHSLNMTDINYSRNKNDSGFEEENQPKGSNRKGKSNARHPKNNVVKYVLPEFTANKIDKTIAFTIHVCNIEGSSINVDKQMDMVHLTFRNNGTGHFSNHFSLFVKFPNAEITNTHADVCDHNLIFKIELSNDDSCEYLAGLDNESELKEINFYENIATRRGDSLQDMQTDSLSIKVAATEPSDNSISIEINNSLSNPKNASENTDEFPNITQHKTNKKGQRSFSESFCEDLKVISENDIAKPVSSAPKEVDISKVTQRKTRSVSESNTGDHKYKGILKQSSVTRSISECSSIDDCSYSTSIDCSVGFVDRDENEELSESCKKSVRFSDVIKKQIFRSNSSILAQKKKNQKKKESKKRSLSRRQSEGESTDNEDKDFTSSKSSYYIDNMENKNGMLDSGVDMSNNQGSFDTTDIPISLKALSKNNVSGDEKLLCEDHSEASVDILFKNDMIFDIEM